MGFSTAQKKALSIIPHVTGSMSMFGSFVIMRYAIIEMRANAASTYHRLLFGMSCFDFLASFSWGLSTWAIPKGTPGVWGAVGNLATCEAQGFLIQLSTAVPVYNVSLAIHALLVGRFEWNAKKIQRVEPFMHGVALAMSLGTAISGIPLKLYNNANLWCWIAPFPMGCKETAIYGDEANCIRGDNYSIYRFAFTFIPVWVEISLCVIFILVVYFTVLKQEKDVDKVQENGLSIRKQSTRVAWQAFWYILALLLTWTPATITRVLQVTPSTKGKLYYPLVVLFTIFLPLQGFLNFLVIFRARFLRFRRDHPRASWKRAIGQAVAGRRAMETEAFTSGLELPAKL